MRRLVHWPSLEVDLERIKALPAAESPQRTTDDKIDEILSRIRFLETPAAVVEAAVLAEINEATARARADRSALEARLAELNRVVALRRREVDRPYGEDALPYAEHRERASNPSTTPDEDQAPDTA